MLPKAPALAAVLLACSLTAAEPTPLQLSMPDASIVLGMDFDRIRAAYDSSRFQEILTPEYRTQMDQSWQSLTKTLGYDVRQVKEVVVSVRVAPEPKRTRALVVVRARFEPGRPPGMLALIATQRSSYMGVPVFMSGAGKIESMAVALLGETTVLVSDLASVHAAIARSKSGIPAHSPLLTNANEFSRKFHIWCVGRDLGSAVAQQATTAKNASPVEAALQSVEAFTLGMTVTPGFEASAELGTKTEKDAAALEGSIRAALACAMTQATPQSKALLNLFQANTLQIASQEKTVRLSLVIPEDKMIEAFKEQMKQGPAWWKGTPLAPGNGSRVSFESGDVVVQGGEAAPKSGAPNKAGDTQVIVLPR